MKTVLRYRIDGEIEFDPNNPGTFSAAAEKLTAIKSAAEEAGAITKSSSKIANAREEAAE